LKEIKVPWAFEMPTEKSRMGRNRARGDREALFVGANKR
jgi:hypothetical protein